jgi:hypothetical protein
MTPHGHAEPGNAYVGADAPIHPGRAKIDGAAITRGIN